MLEVSNLWCGIVRSASLEVAQGECVAVTGPSGSGKTTLLNAIAGYIPYRGNVSIADSSMAHKASWQRPCRYLNQRLYLFPHRTVAGNLALAMQGSGLKPDMARQTRLLNQLNIGHLAHQYPDCISGGEQQRAALARALICQPKLLLLDEPFSSVDWRTRKELWQVLKNLRRDSQVCILLVTHEPQEAAALAERELVMNDGVLQASCCAAVSSHSERAAANASAH